MSREEITKSAEGWIAQANIDIRSKIMKLMRDYRVMPRQLAVAIGENEIDINGILDGTKNVSLEMFVKILIVTGNILEIKPIDDCRPHMEPSMPPFQSAFEERPFERPRPQGFYDIPTPTSIFDDVPSYPRSPRTPLANECEQKSPFNTMPRERLVGIIQDKLWDSEIDTIRATKEELVDFLKAKDRRIKARSARYEDDELSPDIKALRDKIKDTLERKPQFRDYLKKIMQ